MSLRLTQHSYLLIIVVAWGVASPTPTNADTILASAESKGTTFETFQNTSLTQSAQVVYTMRDGVITLQASATGTGSASASLMTLLQRIDQPQVLLNISNSVSTPPDTSTTISLAPSAFTFNISPGGSVILSDFGDIETNATASEPLGTASAHISTTGVQDFFNNSLVPVTVTTTFSADDQLMLSLSGVDGPNETGLAAFDFGAFGELQLTTNGVLTIPLQGPPQTITIDPGNTLSIGGGTGGFDAQASVVPEPSTLPLLGTSSAILLGYARLRRKRAV
ncbi:MAG: PEP-CTERM sorting domain-containing protein [Acidobacteria bacterium]|nr:PEP-CTERM sorting domain-containing protein [Acidobacteriota bacterium]